MVNLVHSTISIATFPEVLNEQTDPSPHFSLSAIISLYPEYCPYAEHLGAVFAEAGYTVKYAAFTGFDGYHYYIYATGEQLLAMQYEGPGSYYLFAAAQSK